MAKKATAKKAPAKKVGTAGKILKGKKTSTARTAQKMAPKKSIVRKAPLKKEKLIQFWAMVTMKKSEAEIHVAFNSPISQLNLEKWTTGYLAIKLKAQGMIIDENMYHDWVRESVNFVGTEDFDRIQDYPFLVQVDGEDGYYRLLLELNNFSM